MVSIDGDIIPVGAMIEYSSDTIIPPGWLLCNGAEFDLTDPEYFDLYSVIGKKFGGDTGNNFKIPDTRGMFLRGYDDGTGRDPDSSSRTIAPWAGATGSSGLEIGSYQPDEFKSHEHQYYLEYAVGLALLGSTRNIVLYMGPNLAVPTSTSFSQGSETRPKNIYVCHIIKYSYKKTANFFTNPLKAGKNAGVSEQENNCVAIGSNAGNLNQGYGSVAIGSYAGINNQHENTIILNASNSPLNSDGTDKMFIGSISQTRTVPTNPSGTLLHDINTKEVFVDTAKTFVIDHPTDKDKYLVHACLEGPEVGVYYRGATEILEDSAEIKIPNYVDKIATDFTIQITPMNDNIYTVIHEDNIFTVYGEKGKFCWIVYGKRKNIDVEPYKKYSKVNGDGPYKWISK